MNLYDKIQETVSFIKEKTKITPQTGLILGSGIGDLSHIFTVETELNYSDIPNFPVSTVKGHEGKLIFGTCMANR